MVLVSVHRGAQLAALIDLLSGQPHSSPVDSAAVASALAWEPQASSGWAKVLAAVIVALVAVLAIAPSMRRGGAAARYAPDDPIRPGGHLRDIAEIKRFMETDVMPWARAALGPIVKGGAGHVTCDTCHGTRADARQWQMPGVATLPQPDVRDEGWERYSSAMDAQMRNAIYGYAAESEKQHHAAYMREVVVPGMARLLHRPAYDFTRTYEYNRSRLAFGCYHCHRVR